MTELSPFIKLEPHITPEIIEYNNIHSNDRFFNIPNIVSNYNHDENIIVENMADFCASKKRSSKSRKIINKISTTLDNLNNQLNDSINSTRRLVNDYSGFSLTTCDSHGYCYFCDSNGRCYKCNGMKFPSNECVYYNDEPEIDTGVRNRTIDTPYIIDVLNPNNYFKVGTVGANTLRGDVIEPFTSNIKQNTGEDERYINTLAIYNIEHINMINLGIGITTSIGIIIYLLKK